MGTGAKLIPLLLAVEVWFCFALRPNYQKNSGKKSPIIASILHFTRWCQLLIKSPPLWSPLWTQLNWLQHVSRGTIHTPGYQRWDIHHNIEHSLIFSLSAAPDHEAVQKDISLTHFSYLAASPNIRHHWLLYFICQCSGVIWSITKCQCWPEFFFLTLWYSFTSPSQKDQVFFF